MENKKCQCTGNYWVFLDYSAFISDYFGKPFLSIEHRRDWDHLSN